MHSLPTATPGFDVAATGDVDDNGDADIILARQDGSGQVITWEIQDSAFVQNHDFGTVADTWRIAGTAIRRTAAP